MLYKIADDMVKCKQMSEVSDSVGKLLQAMQRAGYMQRTD